MSQDHKKETWQNVTRGKAAILRLDVRGVEYGQLVPPSGKVSLSPEERRLNQDRARSREYDLFSNGTFAPVRLVDDEELQNSPDYQEIAENPNFISESDMGKLFKLRIDAFKRRLADIENPAVIARLLEMASDLDAKKSQIEALEARQQDFFPENLVNVETVGKIRT